MIRPVRTGYFISFLIHGLIALAIGFIPFNDLKRAANIIELDFTLAGNETPDTRGANTGALRQVAKTGRNNDAGMIERNKKFEAMPPAESPEKVDPVSAVNTLPDNPLPESGSASRENPGAGPSGSGHAGASVKNLNYLGPGGIDERNFSFIRETILRGVYYPERARRMGWEGKVVLSFTVLENGAISNVKVVNSSGIPALDENARDTVARINLKRKVPVRLFVLLPVEYKLH
ncbi:MAG: energy transducer TonB [Syntrophorhabdaceae bacterium]